MTPPTAARKRRWDDHSVGEHLRAAGWQANEGNGQITVVLGEGNVVDVWGHDLQSAGSPLTSMEWGPQRSFRTHEHADAKALVSYLVSIRDRRTT